jgi:hypothetical protein
MCSDWELGKMEDSKPQHLEYKKFYFAFAVFVVQSIGTVFFVGAQASKVQAAVEVLQRDVNKIEANQFLILQLVKDVAVLQAREAAIQQRLEKLERR